MICPCSRFYRCVNLNDTYTFVRATPVSHVTRHECPNLLPATLNNFVVIVAYYCFNEQRGKRDCKKQSRLPRFEVFPNCIRNQTKGVTFRTIPNPHGRFPSETAWVTKAMHWFERPRTPSAFPRAAEPAFHW